MQPESTRGESSPADPPGFARAAGRGFSWMTLSLLIGKGLILVAQLVLAWFLTREEFGVLAVVAAAAACVKIFHDGGVPQLIVQRGAEEFERLQGAVFWIGIAVSVAAGAILAAAAPSIADFYGDARLTSLLRVLALTLPLGAPASTLRAKLQIDLRFRAISMLSVGKFLIRSVGMIVLAWLGFGLMCFVLPLLAMAVFEVIFTFLATRAAPWLRSPQLAIWPELLRVSGWIIFGTVAKAFARNGDYFVLGRMLPKAVLGPYFFAYMLTTQITGLIALNLKHVLFPVMAKIVGQPDRQANAILRSIRVLVLVAAPASMLIALSFGPVESLIWGGKWAPAIPLVRMFGLVAPILLLNDVTHAALLAGAQFRRSALLCFAEAIWFVTSAWLAATLAGDNITLVAAWIFGMQVLFALVVNGWVLRSFGISLADYV
ncbi:oligosaccharide flippase family protein, partial [Pirellulales bacterium]|nr:oligosaccharide flippase family protein [Pirellulales bacterium]